MLSLVRVLLPRLAACHPAVVARFQTQECPVNIYICDGQAYFELSKGYLLAIGKAEDIVGMTPEQVLELVQTILRLKKGKEVIN